MKIFKKHIPIGILFDLFDKIQLKQDNKYIIDKSFFKKCQLSNLIAPFLEECSPYYIESQKRYLTKKPFLYKSFITVVRQICKLNAIPFYYKIVYFHSEYEIVYFINEEKPGVDSQLQPALDHK